MEWRLIGRDDELASIVDRLRSDRSVLLTGSAGVGKSRLAEEAHAILNATHHVERIIGSPSLAELPFGAVAHLGGAAPLPEASALISFISRAMRRRAERRPIAVVIDDLSLLDDGSLAFVQHLLAHEKIPVLATARTEGAGDPRLVPLWKDGLIERRNLTPLSRPDTDSLAETITGGRCGGPLLNELWRLTEGHPLFVRELLLEGLDQGTLTQEEELWTLAGRLGTSQRVADIVAARTGHLDSAETAALQALALCDPAPLALARRVADGSALERLESKRMIRLESTADGPVLRTSHPLIAEVTVAGMPPLARTTATARLARRLLDSPSPSFQDSMRASLWLLDAGELPPRDAAIDGARAALRAFDPDLAQRLAEAALATGADQQAMVLLGRAHAAQADAGSAIAVLQDAQERARNDAEAAAATTALAEVLLFTLGDASRAVRELEKLLETISDPGAEAEINSHLMMAAGALGDFDLGLKIGPDVADRIDLPEPAQLNSLMAMTLTQTMTGKLTGAIGRLERAERLAEQFAEFQPFASDQVGMNRVLAYHSLAELEIADAFAAQMLEKGVGLPGGWLFVASIGRTITGNVEKGRRLAIESETLLARMDPLGLEPMARGICALFEAMAGNPAASHDRIDMVGDDARAEQTRVAVWVERAQAWNAANGGDPEAGALFARVAGDNAAAGSHYVWSAYAFHDAVRFGHAESVERPLAELSGDDRGPLVRLLADHAAAATDGDPSMLEDVARRAIDIGARALAAEAHARASMFTSGPAHARHAHLARHHYRRCAELSSPLLDTVASPITERQREIAALAASGNSSKDIARGLHLSARTVDNHLRSVYQAFEIDGRGELRALFPA